MTSIAADTLCFECGYNLRGLDEQSLCPECGHAAAFTLLRKATVPKWLVALSRGSFLIAVSLMLDIAIGLFVLANYRAAFLLHALSPLLGAKGAWLFFTADPLHRRGYRLSNTGRILAIAVATFDLQMYLVVALAEGVGLYYVPDPLAEHAFAAFCLLWAIESALIFYVAARIARRIEDRAAIIQAKILCVLSALAISAVGGTVLTKNPSTPHIIVLGILVALTALWSALFFTGFAIRLRRSAGQRELPACARDR
jgi:hypothetical protein